MFIPLSFFAAVLALSTSAFASGEAALSPASSVAVSVEGNTETAEVSLSTGTLVTGDSFNPLVSWNLNHYQKSLKVKSGGVDLEAVTNERAQDQLLLAFDTADFLYLAKAKGNLSREKNAVVWTYDDKLVHIVRRISGSPEQPYARVDWKVDFKDKAPKTAYLTTKLTGGVKDDVEAAERQFAYFGKEVVRHSADDFSKELSKFAEKGQTGEKVVGHVKWIATLSRYFIVAIVPEGQSADEVYYAPLSAVSGLVSMGFAVKNNSVSISSRVYFGPKEIELLRRVDPGLDTAVDFGWLTFLAYPMLRLLRFLYELFHNYGVAIILLTVFIKIITFPLNYKAAKGTQRMSKLQPFMAKLKEKHKDDMPTYNKEVMALMKSSGANPMAGCFPVLIQMPVFFALFRVLNYAVELYQAPFAGWIVDLSVKDPFYVTPILLTALMFLQQKLTPTPATIDPIQKKMFQFLPIIFGVTMLGLPAGLTIYMLTNSIASIAQQVWMNRKLGIGNVNPVAART